MAGRFLAVAVAFSAVLAFLLLFASGSHVEAVTYKLNYGLTLSCDGPDGAPTGWNSCAPGTEHGAGVSADTLNFVQIPQVSPIPPNTPRHSQFRYQVIAGAPAGWKLATDKEVPDGAYVGTIRARVYLALLNSTCTNFLDLTFPVFDCSTDNSAGNLVDWVGDGSNLVADGGGGLPVGCKKYPKHVNDILGGLKPRARYMGVQAVYPGSPPTQVQFMIFNPGQLSTNPAPEASMGDSLGYPAFFVLANPIAPATPSTISEFCSPMTTDVKFWGKTAGDGALIPGSAWNVSAEICGDGIDNDNDKKVDELCGIVRQSNPAAGKGIYGSGTHLATAYNESYRDADGDGIPNNEDSCPFTAGVPDYTNGCNGCAAGTCTTGDQDNDGFDNQQDSCPFTNDKETGAQCDNNTDDDGDDYVNDGCPAVGPPETGTQCANNTDDDSPPDGKVNDGCTVIGSKDDDRDAIGNPCDTLGASGIGQGPNVPDGPYVNDLVRAAVCVEAADADGDGWCDATETALGSDPNAAAKTPEYRGVDFPIVAAEDPPGTAPGTCTNWDYYDSTQNHPADPHRNGAGNKVDDDGDTLVNLADPGCVWGTTWDADADGVPTADPCEGIVAGTVTAEALRTVSRTMTLPSPPGPAKDLCLVYNSKTNFGGTWWSGLNSATVTVNASGCGAPSTVTAGTLLDGNEGIKIVWPTACVDPNESVTVQFRTDATAQPAAAPYGESCVTIWTGATGPLQVDNCPAVYNPEQRDTDGDGLGDACETDDDNDKALDSAEWAAGNDAKNVCDPVNFDLKKDGSITILDVLMFSNALMGKPCAPPVNYSVCP